MTFLSNLAQKTGAPIVFATMQRLPDNTGYHLHFFPSTQALLDTDPLTAATALNHHVEQCIAVAPDQYIWTYKRFKKHLSAAKNAITRRSHPGGLAVVYQFPDSLLKARAAKPTRVSRFH